MSEMYARLTFAFLLLLASSCSHAPPAPRHLLLVTVDTLRADALGCYGSKRPSTDAAQARARGSTPGFTLDEIAAQGQLFENAFTPRSMTFPALASLFTGLSPIEHGALSNGDLLPGEHETLAETLARAGFFTAAFTTNKLLVPGSGIEQGFASFQTDFSPARDENMAAAAARCLREHAGQGQRVFVWLHLVGPHLPYAPEPLAGADFRALCCAPGYQGLADGSREYADKVHAAGTPLADADLEHMRGLYAGEVARVDHVLSRLFADLSGGGGSNVLEQSLLVFAADHGEELGERNAYFGHSKSVTSAGLQVPLVLRHPATIAAGRTRTLVGLQELPGRIARALGLESRAPRSGRPLEVGLWRDRIFSARDERWRLVWNPEKLELQETPPGPYPVPEIALYDELSDPRDEHELGAQHPEQVARLRGEIEHWRARQKRWSGKQSAPDEARQRALKEMGYAGEKEARPAPPR
jgi:arylsulfatase